MPAVATAPRPPAHAVLNRVEALRRALRAFRRQHALLHAGVVATVLATLLVAVDWYFVLPMPWRAVGLLCAVAVAGVTLIRRRAPDVAPEQAAQVVEEAHPPLGQRLRTTLEYTFPGPDTMPAAPGLIDALAQDTDRRTADVDFGAVVPWRTLRRPKAVVGLVVAAHLALLALLPEWRTALLRLFLLPAHYTQVAVTPGDKSVPVGSEVAAEVTLTGRPVAEPALLYRPATGDGDWTRLPLAEGDSRPQAGTFAVTLPKLEASVDYKVVAGAVESDTYRLTVLHPLTLKSVEAQVEPPAYTRRPVAVVTEGNLKVAEGSAVHFQFDLDRPPTNAQLVLRPKDGPAQALPLRIEGSGLRGDLANLKQSVDYEVEAVAADGMRLEGARFRLEVVPDRKPTVRFVKPKDTLEATPSTEVVLRVEGGDDHGLAQVGVVYQVGDGPKKTLYLHAPEGAAPRHAVDVVLPLEEHQLTHQDSVTYHAFAEDNRPDDPQRAQTELQFIDIRPYKRAYQLLKTGGS